MGFFRKYFIPHEENENRPHFWREASVLSLALIILIVFITASSGRFLISRGTFTAAVISGVLADLANQDRQVEMLGMLAINPILERAATLKANDMASKSYFAHTSPEGKNPWYWFKEAGYEFSYAGENLAVNFSDSALVNQAWMNSPGHRKNILNGNFTEVGIATAEGMYEGRPTVFVVQLFGKPATLQVEEEGTSAVSSEKQKIETTVPKTSVATKTKEVLSTVASTSVLGAEGESELFVAVAKEPIEIEQANSSVASPAVTASSLSIFLSSPSMLLRFLFSVLAAIIVLALLFTAVVEFTRHHSRHLLYALLLLALIAILFYLYHAVLFAPLLIL